MHSHVASRSRQLRRLDLDDWRAELQSICGRFEPVATGSEGVGGRATRKSAGGLDCARIIHNAPRISRSQEDIRRDQNEYFFLILQKAGTCEMDLGRSLVRLNRGDVVLIDSTLPLDFRFSGALSDQLSLHLPRQILLSSGSVPAIGRVLERRDAMSGVLSGLLETLLDDTKTTATAARTLRELVLSSVRLSFTQPTEHAWIDPATRSRLDRALELIDRNLTDSGLTPPFVAESLGVSLRRLQEDFQAIATTCALTIRARRLRLARERLIAHASAPDRGLSISTIAFDCGFSDISYFNRCFRAEFGCPPGALFVQRQR
ncbi:helix-turn-helix domain-containing protein [Acidisoma sp. 7E03]